MKPKDFVFPAAYIAIAMIIVYTIILGFQKRELDNLRAHRAAVADVENFIYQQYPTIDAATRRGHAEILISSTCVEIVENTMACPGGGLTRQTPQEVRQYAKRAAEAHGVKP